MSKKIYIFLPVHNRRDITRRFLGYLKSQSYQDYHLILIDDGSTDNTDEMVRVEITAVTVIKGEGDWWWAGSLQQGYNWLKTHDVPLSDIVLITNDDTHFEPDFFEKAVAILRDRERTLLLAQCFYSKTGDLNDAGVHVDWKRLTFHQAKTVEEINCLSTRGLFLKVGDLLATGGFYPKLLPHYLSDYEFTIRANHKGMKLLTDPSLKIWFDEEASGYHSLEEKSFLASLKRLFSIKSSRNPLAWTVFIALASPWPWKLTNWLRVLKAFFENVIECWKASRRPRLTSTGSS
ncbi:MAG: glycosyltransferase [Geobacteraceae bacterium]|jgi:GT2 family glycosyltransferase